MRMVGGKERLSSHPQPMAAIHNLSIEHTKTDPHPLLFLPGLWNLDFSPRLLLLLCPWCRDEEVRPQDCTCARRGLIPQSDLCFVFEYMWYIMYPYVWVHVGGCLCTCVGVPEHASRNAFRGPGVITQHFIHWGWVSPTQSSWYD